MSMVASSLFGVATAGNAKHVHSSVGDNGRDINVTTHYDRYN
ncbi:hypothetical protein ACULNC_11460 [Shigella flexneri]